MAWGPKRVAALAQQAAATMAAEGEGASCLGHGRRGAVAGGDVGLHGGALGPCSAGSGSNGGRR